MNRHLLDRRQFNALCALGLSLPTAGTMIAALSGGSALAAGADTSPNAAGHTVKFPDGTIVPALGQGSWHLGQGRHPAAVEEEALRIGISLGMTLIDTSGNYGDGRSEKFIGHVIAGQRDRVFLVSKVETNDVTGDGIARACEASLARLGTDYLDLYLLHSPVPSSAIPRRCSGIRTTARGGKDSRLGRIQLQHGPDGRAVPCSRRPSLRDQSGPLQSQQTSALSVTFCHGASAHNMPVMAYSPLGGDSNLLVGDHTLAQYRRHSRLLGRRGCAGLGHPQRQRYRNSRIRLPAHVKENAVALALTLTPQELETLDAAYPAPSAAN